MSDCCVLLRVLVVSLIWTVVNCDVPPGNVDTKERSWAGFPLQCESSNRERESTVHCVGENFLQDAWMYRSCQFRHLCYHPSRAELNEEPFRLVVPKETLALTEIVNQLQGSTTRDSPQPARRDIWISSLMDEDDAKMALRPIAPFPTTFEEYQTLYQDSWFPLTSSKEEILANSSFARCFLPNHAVWVPWEPDWSSDQPESTLFTTPLVRWIWRDFLAIHTVLALFGLIHDVNGTPATFPRLLLMGRNASQCHALPSSAENSGYRPETARCPTDEQRRILDLLLPAMGVTLEQVFPPRPMHTVCSRRAATGLGMIASLDPRPQKVSKSSILAAHLRDTDWTHTVGRGSKFRDARDWMAANLGVPIASSVHDMPGPLRITFWRRKNATTQGQLVGMATPTRVSQFFDFVSDYAKGSELLNGASVSFEGVDWSGWSLKQQAQHVAGTTIFVTACGDDTIAGTFLTRDAVAIVYCDVKDDISVLEDSDISLELTVHANRRWSHRLDYAVLTGAAYFRSFWLASPRQAHDSQEADKLIQLILDEIARITS
jgi:hypothetical protein